MTTLRDVILDPKGLLLQEYKAGKLLTSASIVAAFNLTVAMGRLPPVKLIDHFYDKSDRLVLVAARPGSDREVICLACTE